MNNTGDTHYDLPSDEQDELSQAWAELAEATQQAATARKPAGTTSPTGHNQPRPATTGRQNQHKPDTSEQFNLVRDDNPKAEDLENTKDHDIDDAETTPDQTLPDVSGSRTRTRQSAPPQTQRRVPRTCTEADMRWAAMLL